MKNVIMSLDVTISTPSEIYKDSIGIGKQVIIVSVGKCTVGYLHRLEGNDQWFVYGYKLKPDLRGRKGNMKDILGTSDAPEEMARRLLMYKGFLISNPTIGVEYSGIIEGKTSEHPTNFSP